MHKLQKIFDYWYLKTLWLSEQCHDKIRLDKDYSNSIHGQCTRQDYLELNKINANMHKILIILVFHNEYLRWKETISFLCDIQQPPLLLERPASDSI